MRNFFKYILKLIAFSILILIISDICFSIAFYKCVPRTKLQFVLKNDNKKYNNVFLGSSRVANHIDVKYLDSISGQRSLNLGVEGANYIDNLLLLEVFLKNNNSTDKLFLQLDHFYEYNEMSAIANSDALPFVRNQIIASHFKKYDKNFNAYYYLPFYRFLTADFKIGFREFFMSTINKKPRVDFEYGFIPKYNKGDISISEQLPNKINKNNIYVEKIIELCKQYNIELILFCSPFSSHTKGLSYIDKLKKKYPNLHDYSRTINDNEFSNCTHLDFNGAREFTFIIFQNHLTNE